jgi:hypothetical protein
MQCVKLSLYVLLKRHCKDRERENENEQQQQQQPTIIVMECLSVALSRRKGEKKATWKTETAAFFFFSSFSCWLPLVLAFLPLHSSSGKQIENTHTHDELKQHNTLYRLALPTDWLLALSVLLADWLLYVVSLVSKTL